MNRSVLAILIIFLNQFPGYVMAEEHILIGVKETGYFFENIGKPLNKNELRETASKKKIDRITLVVDKCIEPTRIIDVYIALTGLGIKMISVQTNWEQHDFECEGT